MKRPVRAQELAFAASRQKFAECDSAHCDRLVRVL
jgi:hypothetical protein